MDTTQFDADLSLRLPIFAEDDRFDWNLHLRYAHEQTQYPPDLPVRYFRALTEFRELLGDSFLWQVRYTHPLANMILEPVPWKIQLLCEYADLLQHLFVNDPDCPIWRKNSDEQENKLLGGINLLIERQVNYIAIKNSVSR